MIGGGLIGAAAVLAIVLLVLRPGASPDGDANPTDVANRADSAESSTGGETDSPTKTTEDLPSNGATGATASQPGFESVGTEEFVGPFPSWLDVKRDFGAIGDGQADDTDALQSALDQLGQGERKRTVLFLPAGTYRITRGLRMVSHMHVGVLGEHPSRTIIKWDGDQDGGVMLHCNGVRYSRFGRITWDGSGKSVTGVFHEWDGKTPNAATHLLHSDHVFRDVAFGIRAGKPHFMDAETLVLRCKFLRCSEAGVRIQSFNALDWWIWDSEFVDCKHGVTNHPGAGHFHVYQSVFRNSKSSDIYLEHTEYFSFRHNTSIGSRKFLGAGFSQPNSLIMLQNNRIIDPRQTNAIAVGNSGPLVMLDNLIVHRDDAELQDDKNRPIAFVTKWGGKNSDFVEINNRFTLKPQVQVAGRHLSSGRQHVDRRSLDLSVPSLPPIPENRGRTVREIAPNSTDVEIQSAIDQAARSSEQRPIIHFAAGKYVIRKTLTVPADRDLQLVGDGYQSRLEWDRDVDAGGPMLLFKGPSRATLRNLHVSGWAKADPIVVENCDQPGSRVFCRQVDLRGGPILKNSTADYGLLVDGLDETNVDLQAVQYQVCQKAGIQVNGGPRTLQGAETQGRTVVFGGGASDNEFTFNVARGGRLMVQDAWYEGAPANFVNLTDSGEFTLSGAMVASGRAPGSGDYLDPASAGVKIDNFRGQATFLTTRFRTRTLILGSESNMNVLVLGCAVANLPQPFVNQSTAGQVAVASTRGTEKGSSVGRQIANQGLATENTGSGVKQSVVDEDFLNQMLDPIRKYRLKPLKPIRSGATDLRLFRVQITRAKTCCLQLKRDDR